MQEQEKLYRNFLKCIKKDKNINLASIKNLIERTLHIGYHQNLDWPENFVWELDDEQLYSLIELIEKYFGDPSDYLNDLHKRFFAITDTSVIDRLLLIDYSRIQQNLFGNKNLSKDQKIKILENEFHAWKRIQYSAGHIQDFIISAIKEIENETLNLIFDNLQLIYQIIPYVNSVANIERIWDKYKFENDMSYHILESIIISSEILEEAFSIQDMHQHKNACRICDYVRHPACTESFFEKAWHSHKKWRTDNDDHQFIYSIQKEGFLIKPEIVHEMVERNKAHRFASKLFSNLETLTNQEGKNFIKGYLDAEKLLK